MNDYNNFHSPSSCRIDDHHMKTLMTTTTTAAAAADIRSFYLIDNSKRVIQHLICEY